MKVFSPRLPTPDAPNYLYELESLLFRYSAAINDSEHRGGTTDERPTGADLRIGRMYFDTTLGTPIWWAGTEWVDATGTTA